MNEKKYLLIVEDDSRFRKSLEVALRNDFKIDSVGSLDEALILIAENNYDIVSTDGAFPEYKGGYVGNHGTLYEEDYRGGIVAKVAKKKGIYVVGLTNEPEKLIEPDVVINKKDLSISDYIKILNKNKY